MLSRSLTLLLGLAGCLGAAEMGRALPVPAAPPPAAGVGAQFFGAGTKAEMLTLEQAIELALRNNLDAQFEKVGIGIEEARRRAAVGAFDPTFNISAIRESLRRPENANDFTSTDALRQVNQTAAINANTAASLIGSAAINAQTNAINADTNARNAQTNLVNKDSALPTNLPTDLPTTAPDSISTHSVTVGLDRTIFDQQNDRLSGSLQGRTPWGMRYGVQVEADKLRNTFTGDLRTVFPEYQTTVNATIIQPVLKNFGADANLVDVRVARLSKKTQVITWKLRISTAIQSVMSTYYDMVYAMKDVEVKQDAIRAGEKLLEQNKRRLALGFMSPVDVHQAEVAVSTDRESLLISKGFYMESQFKLKRLILAKFDASDRRVFVPMNAPRLVIPPINRAALMQTAFARRYDYQASLIDAEIQNVRLRFAKNQLWPELDLVGTYGFNGLEGSYGDAFGEGFSGHTPSWSGGVQVQIPWGFVKERAQVNLVQGLKEQALLKIKQTELTVGVDVDTVLSRIETNRQRVDTARQTREFGEEAVRIADKRLEEGQGSSFELIEQQRKLYDAKSRELAALGEYNKSVTQLWLATGTILDRQGIFFDK